MVRKKGGRKCVCERQADRQANRLEEGGRTKKKEKRAREMTRDG